MNKHDDLFYLGLKIILRNPENRILLLKMVKTDETFWELPGGRIQIGETPEQGLRRELLEETGIKTILQIRHVNMHVSPYRILMVSGQSVGLIFSVYCGRVTEDIVNLSSDHVDYVWATDQEVLKLLGNAYGEKLSDYLTESKL